MYQSLSDVWLASVSGGTDVAGIFLGGAPSEPVRAGRLQPPALGSRGGGVGRCRPTRDRRGRGVGDHGSDAVHAAALLERPDGSRSRSSYFETFPGVWRHGDLVEFASMAAL